MKISKLLNNKIFLLSLFFIFSNSVANEPADIWNIDKTTTKDIEINNEGLVPEEISEETISIYDLNNQKKQNNKNQVLLENNIEDKISLFGIYDPDENNLSIEMWNKSEGDEIKKIFDKIFSQNLSNDALDILEIALLTNSNTPIKNITKEEFYKFQKNFLIKKDDLELIKLFIQKNPEFIFKDDLINHFANNYIAEANIEESCEILSALLLYKIILASISFANFISFGPGATKI